MSVTKTDLARAKKVAAVDLSEWIDGEDATGYVCAISAGKALRLPDEGKDNAAVYAWVIHCFCAADGTLIFDDDDDSRAFFSDRPFGMIQAICEAAMTVNGIGKEGQKDTEKN